MELEAWRDEFDIFQRELGLEGFKLQIDFAEYPDFNIECHLFREEKLVTCMLANREMLKSQDIIAANLIHELVHYKYPALSEEEIWVETEKAYKGMVNHLPKPTKWTFKGAIPMITGMTFSLFRIYGELTTILRMFIYQIDTSTLLDEIEYCRTLVDEALKNYDITQSEYTKIMAALDETENTVRYAGLRIPLMAPTSLYVMDLIEERIKKL